VSDIKPFISVIAHLEIKKFPKKTRKVLDKIRFFMYKYNGMIGLINKFVKSETAQADTEYSLLILLLVASIIALKFFSTVMKAVLVKAAGKIIGAV